MPTKQTSSFFSARAAAIGHHLVRLVVGHDVYSAAARCLRAYWAKASGPLSRTLVFIQARKRVAFARDRVPFLVEGVVARVIALRIRREGAARHLDDMADGPVRQHHRVEAAVGRQLVDDLLDRHHRALGGQHRFLLHAEHALDHHIAGLVGALGMDHRHVRPVRRDRRQLLAGERAGHALDLGIHLRQVAADIAAENSAGQARRARLVGIGHGGVRMLLDLQLVAASRSRPRRGSDAASRRPDCRPRKKPACRRSPCR